MSLYHLRRRVDALKRRIALPYTVVRLRPYAEQFCDSWAAAISDRQEPPPVSAQSSVPADPSAKSRPKPFMSRLTEAGFRLPTWMELHEYFDRCRENRIYPHPNDIVRTLLPRAAYLGLVPRSPDSIIYPHFTANENAAGLPVPARQIPSPSGRG